MKKISKVISIFILLFIIFYCVIIIYHFKNNNKHINCPLCLLINKLRDFNKDKPKFIRIITIIYFIPILIPSFRKRMDKKITLVGLKVKLIS